MSYNSLDSQAIEHFKEYLKIPSVQPDVDYSACVKFLKNQAARIGLSVMVEEVAPRKPVVILTWLGVEKDLPSVLLSSHMDVVPVFADLWTHDPFGAEQDEHGNIYARGAQDMKCVGVQYMEAVYRLKTQGYQPKRSIHLCFTPDEEIGSIGMQLFVETDIFRKLNVGFELDEGYASVDDSFELFYGERTSYRIKIICPGTPGHGSLLHENTAGEKLSLVIRKFMEKRAEEKKQLEDDEKLSIGDVTTINLTMIEGGVQSNVVPPELIVTFDCRVSLKTDHQGFERWMEGVCEEAGEGVRVEYCYRKNRTEPTPMDESNPWWMALKSQFKAMNLKVNARICPAASDARYIRALGIPAFGFSPMNHTPVKLHDHDEFLNDKIFLKGIEIYINIICALANV